MRVLVALTVPDDTDTHELAMALDLFLDGADATVWTFEEFFDDLDDDVIGRHHDHTTST
jgi:hypothetical protein